MIHISNITQSDLNGIKVEYAEESFNVNNKDSSDNFIVMSDQDKEQEQELDQVIV